MHQKTKNISWLWSLTGSSEDEDGGMRADAPMESSDSKVIGPGGGDEAKLKLFWQVPFKDGGDVAKCPETNLKESRIESNRWKIVLIFCWNLPLGGPGAIFSILIIFCWKATGKLLFALFHASKSINPSLHCLFFFGHVATWAQA